MRSKRARQIRRMITKTGGTKNAYRRAKRGWTELPQSLKDKMGRAYVRYE